MQPPAKKKLTFFDPEDGKLDMSDFLLNHKGALPVPTIITEPAVGYGFGLGLLFSPNPWRMPPPRPGPVAGAGTAEYHGAGRCLYR
jgi:hypothetical protein